MRLYGGDDLHSTNNVLALVDETGRGVFRRRLPNEMVATKAVAHKLARACFYVLRDQVPFELTKSFV